MRTATSSFGPFDVVTLGEIVHRIDDYDDGEAIYVKDGERLKLDMPAAVTNKHVGRREMEEELRFRYLSDVDDAREVIWSFRDRGGDEAEMQELLEMIEQWGM